MLQEIAELALSDPVRALEVIGPPARYLDGAYMRLADDLLEGAARRPRDGTSDLRAFSHVVDDVARQVRLSRRTVEALRTGAALPGAPRVRRRPSRRPLARFRPYLVEVAGRYTDLRRVGARFVGRCPLHEDARPSFICYPDGRFFCFGCLQWGDAVDLVTRLERLPVREAAAQLAREFGDERSAPPSLRQGEERSLPRLVGAQGETADPLRR